jgi:hypothetical protein
VENLTRPGPKAGVAADTAAAAAARDYLEKCGVIQMLGDAFGPGRVRFSTRFSQHVTLESGNYDGRLRSSRTCAKAILRRSPIQLRASTFESSNFENMRL